MLWFALAVMTGLAVLVALWPLAFRRARPPEAPSEVGFYQAQLAEIDRDVDRGQLAQSEAAAARAEAARRLIAASASEAAGAPGGDDLKRRRVAAVLILIAIPLTALGAYGLLGRPDLPDAPLAERKADVASPAALEAAIAKIEAHLAATPDDARGWRLLAPVYMRMGRYDAAANAFRQLLRLEGENGGRRADYGEALVAAAGGAVTSDARADVRQGAHRYAGPSEGPLLSRPRRRTGRRYKKGDRAVPVPAGRFQGRRALGERGQVQARQAEGRTGAPRPRAPASKV